MIKVIIRYEKSFRYPIIGHEEIADQRDCDTLLECFQYLQDNCVWYGRSGFEFLLSKECVDGTRMTWDLEFPDFSQKKINQLGNAYSEWEQYNSRNFENKYGGNW
jgi:hypothetical protein